MPFILGFAAVAIILMAALFGIAVAIESLC
jgi:hypothetical protein